MRRHWTHRNRGRARLGPQLTRLLQLGLLLFSLCTAGCSLVSETHRVFFLAKRTVDLEPKRFPYFRNAKFTRLRNRALAKQVWGEIAAESPEPFSEHYSQGFVSGFADYLYRGGSGDAPPIPPRSYWHMGYQSPEGKQAIQDWYDGFRHGSQECQASGYRQLAVVPSSRPDGVKKPVGDPARLEQSARERPLDHEVLPPPDESEPINVDDAANIDDQAELSQELWEALGSFEALEPYEVAGSSASLSEENVASAVQQAAGDQQPTSDQRQSVRPSVKAAGPANPDGPATVGDGWFVPDKGSIQMSSDDGAGEGWQADDSLDTASRWSPYRPVPETDPSGASHGQ